MRAWEKVVYKASNKQFCVWPLHSTSKWTALVTIFKLLSKQHIPADKINHLSKEIHAYITQLGGRYSGKELQF